MCPTALFFPTVGRATTWSTCQPLNSSGSIIGRYSPTSKTISTGSRTSGTRRSVTCASSTVFRRLNSGYIQKNVSENLKPVTHWINYPKSNNGLTITSDRYLGQSQDFYSNASVKDLVGRAYSSKVHSLDKALRQLQKLLRQSTAT